MAGAESGFRVWIDQDLCTGDGICVEIAPRVFYMKDDGMAYVMNAAGVKTYEGSDGTVPVPASQLDDVIESAVECPGECIFIEPEV